jgi:hypothetical protein
VSLLVAVRQLRALNALYKLLGDGPRSDPGFSREGLVCPPGRATIFNYVTREDNRAPSGCLNRRCTEVIPEPTEVHRGDA